MGVLHLSVSSYLHAYEFLWSLKYTCIPLHLDEIALKMFCILLDVMRYTYTVLSPEISLGNTEKFTAINFPYEFVITFFVFCERRLIEINITKKELILFNNSTVVSREAFPNLLNCRNNFRCGSVYNICDVLLFIRKRFVSISLLSICHRC